MINLPRRLAGRAARSILLRFGKKIVDLPSGWASPNHIWKRILELQPEVVIDIGANEGQFALEMRHAGYNGQMISFEPQPDVYDKLSKISESDNNWECQQFAIGDSFDKLRMHVSATSQSSSLFPIGKTHTDLMPHTIQVSEIEVSVIPLDYWASSASIGGKKIFLKVDVQGYELQALEGASKVINSVVGALIELNFVTLFDGQSKYYEVIGLLEKAGLTLAALVSAQYHPESGDLLWADGFFIKNAGGK